jgi:hypothetical protein
VQRNAEAGLQVGERSVSSAKKSDVVVSIGAHIGICAAVRRPLMVTCVPGGPIAGVSVSVGSTESAANAGGPHAITAAPHSIKLAATSSPRLHALPKVVGPLGMSWPSGVVRQISGQHTMPDE